MECGNENLLLLGKSGKLRCAVSGKQYSLSLSRLASSYQIIFMSGQDLYKAMLVDNAVSIFRFLSTSLFSNSQKSKTRDFSTCLPAHSSLAMYLSGYRLCALDTLSLSLPRTYLNFLLQISRIACWVVILPSPTGNQLSFDFWNESQSAAYFDRWHSQQQKF